MKGTNLPIRVTSVVSDPSIPETTRKFDIKTETVAKDMKFHNADDEQKKW